MKISKDAKPIAVILVALLATFALIGAVIWAERAKQRRQRDSKKVASVKVVTERERNERLDAERERQEAINRVQKRKAQQHQASLSDEEKTKIIRRKRELEARRALRAAARNTSQTSPPMWSMINFVDSFGERTDRGAMSPKVESIRPMSFPYADITARIFVNCDRAWIRFSESPNINSSVGNIHDGYTTYFVSARVNGIDAGVWSVNQTWGDNDLRFTNNSKAISALASGSKFAVSISWYGQSAAAFSWPLSGSSRAIQDSCA